jgi:prolyl-tRNA synthetase
VGNIFKLGTRFSEPLGLTYKDEAGADHPVVMGSYGIGPSRALGTVAELCADEKGLVWPKEVAPFDVHVVRLGDSEQTTASADALVETLETNGVTVLYDDRSLRPGEKFADSDLIGVPVRVVVSDKTVASGTYEVVERASGTVKMQSEEELLGEVA